MSPFDPETPPGSPTPTETPTPDGAVPRPRERSAHEGAKDAFVRMLATRYRAFIAVTCRGQGELTEPSREDLAQRVLLIAAREFDKQAFATRGPPRNIEGWLTKLIHNEACNYGRQGEREVERADDVAAPFSPEPDPEGALELAEKRAKLEGYLKTLPKDEEDMLRYADLYGVTIDQLAAELGLPWGTVAAKLARARGKLVDLARESERATLAGKRRR